MEKWLHLADHFLYQWVHNLLSQLLMWFDGMGLWAKAPHLQPIHLLVSWASSTSLQHTLMQKNREVRYFPSNPLTSFLSTKKQYTTWWCSWLRHYATNQKVAGSVPSGVTGIFQWLKPLRCTMTLGSTQPTPTAVSTIAYGWQPCHLHGPTVYKFWKPQPPAALIGWPGL